MSEFSFGSDPEFMLSTNGKYFSAIGNVPGTKDSRYKIGPDTCYYDNVMAECTITPAKSADEAIKNIKRSLTALAKIVIPLKLTIQASQHYPTSELQHPDAKKVGCDPERCAYSTEEVTPPISKIKGSSLRSAGGHIHLGSDAAKGDLNNYNVVRMLDLLLGVPSVLIDKDPTSVERKQLYGKAGRYRKTTYGVEYRSLGNFWLISPKLVSWVFNTCKFTTEFVKAKREKELWTYKEPTDDEINSPGFTFANCHTCHGYDIKSLRKAMDTGDTNKSLQFIPLIKKLMPVPLFNEFEAIYKSSAYRPENFYKEWGIKEWGINV